MPFPVSTDSPLSAELLRQALGALRTVVHRAAETDLAILIAGGTEVQADEAAPPPPQDDRDSPGQTLAEATARFQAEYIGRTIEQSAGNISRAAGRLGLNRSNLYRKMRQLGMESPEGGN
ncbi:MAG: helix-turn-helix domain-containing protein [Thermoguttaceae bacterium]